SFAERERLFRAGLGWDAYDPAVLSPGGAVLARAAKRVTLSPEARAMLGLGDAAVSGERLVQAVLTLDVDLLWNGGIGTYVAATDETDAQVHDAVNDPVRVKASALRARVVAEGGNLGFTQRARIEYALAGGRINTDAVDNSAGVDMSDHEVNLKICLRAAVEDGRLTPEERNALLASVSDEIAARVLAHNRAQSRLLTLDQARSRRRLADFRQLIAELERAAGLDRALEALPDADTPRGRRRARPGDRGRRLRAGGRDHLPARPRAHRGARHQVDARQHRPRAPGGRGRGGARRGDRARARPAARVDRRGGGGVLCEAALRARDRGPRRGAGARPRHRRLARRRARRGHGRARGGRRSGSRSRPLLRARPAARLRLVVGTARRGGRGRPLAGAGGRGPGRGPAPRPAPARAAGARGRRRRRRGEVARQGPGPDPRPARRAPHQPRRAAGRGPRAPPGSGAGVTMAVIRFLFALLLGFMLGTGSVLYLIHSGAGDFMIRRTEPVQDLERRLRDVEQQRDQLGRQLDDVINRAGRMEASFGELERRFGELQRELDRAHGEAGKGK